MKSAVFLVLGLGGFDRSIFKETKAFEGSLPESLTHFTQDFYWTKLLGTIDTHTLNFSELFNATTKCIFM